MADRRHAGLESGGVQVNVERMEKALHEVWKYYDEAGETGQNYVLDPDNLTKFAADLCKEYQNLDNHKRGPDYTRKPVEHSE